jgi:hypothetical protein
MNTLIFHHSINSNQHNVKQLGLTIGVHFIQSHIALDQVLHPEQRIQ